MVIIKLSNVLSNFDKRKFSLLMEETLMRIREACVFGCPRDSLVNFGGMSMKVARGQVDICARVYVLYLNLRVFRENVVDLK